MTPHRIICVGTGNVAADCATRLKTDPRFSLVGYAPDPTHNSTVGSGHHEAAMHRLHVPRLDVSAVADTDCDLVLVNECRTWLKDPGLFSRLAVNVHSGLLPKYRGLHANAWALLNGETALGFSVHRLTADLDAGALFHVERMSIADNETYSDYKPRLMDRLVTTLPDILAGILTGTLPPHEQSDDGARYCAALRATDGVIEDFNLPAATLRALYRVFAKPIGTGLHTTFGQRSVELVNVTVPIDVERYDGIVGTVVRKLATGAIWVKTQDRVIAIEQLIIDGRAQPAGDALGLGNRLGQRHAVSYGGFSCR